MCVKSVGHEDQTLYISEVIARYQCQPRLICASHKGSSLFCIFYVTFAHPQRRYRISNNSNVQFKMDLERINFLESVWTVIVHAQALVFTMSTVSCSCFTVTSSSIAPLQRWRQLHTTYNACSMHLGSQKATHLSPLTCAHRTCKACASW